MKAMLWMQRMAGMVLLMGAAGCEQAVVLNEPPPVANSSEFVLRVEPAGAMTVTEAREKLENKQQIVLVGKINAGDIEPWEVGRAAFFISDHEAHEHHHADGHDHENCPFCKGAMSVTDTLAIIQFVDEEGQIIAEDARQMLGVAKDQIVVARGRGEMDDLGNLILTADGIYIRR